MNCFLHRTKLSINIYINIERIIDINENELFFTTKLTLIRKWSNSQLTFQKYKKNKMSSEYTKRMWTPWFVFDNIPKNFLDSMFFWSLIFGSKIFLNPKYTGCPIIKFTFLIDHYLSPLILLRDCSVLEIYVLISSFKITMFLCSIMFTF